MEQEKDREKKESRRQASEAQREKGPQRFRARDKKQRRHFCLLEKQHENFVAAVTTLFGLPLLWYPYLHRLVQPL